MFVSGQQAAAHYGRNQAQALELMDGYERLRNHIGQRRGQIREQLDAARLELAPSSAQDTSFDSARLARFAQDERRCDPLAAER